MARLDPVIFDFDGTVADTKQMIADIAIEVCRDYSQKVPDPAKIEALRGKDMKEIVREFMAYGKSLWLLPFILAEGRKRYLQRHESIRPCGSMCEVIRDLSKDREVLILSSNDKKTIYNVLNRWNLKCNGVYHSIKYLGFSVLFGKGRELKRIMKERPGKTPAYVFDEVRDYRACLEAEVEPIPVLWGFNNESAFLKAGADRRHFVREPSELVKKIEELESA